MRQRRAWLTAGAIIFALQTAACQRHQVKHEAEQPAEVEEVAGSDVKRVTLTARAVERIDLKTDSVREERVARSGSLRKMVPYSALIYDPQGQTWVYTSPEPRSFVRQRVVVDYIEGDVAVLNEGPPAGTPVASVGVAELYGTEFGIGH